MECSRSFYLEQLDFRESSTIHVTALFDPTSPVHRPTIKATIICNFSHSCSHTYKSLAKRNTNQSLASNHSKSQLIDLHTQSRSHKTKTSTTFKDTATLTRLVQHLFPSYKTRRVRDSRRIVNDILFIVLKPKPANHSREKEFPDVARHLHTRHQREFARLLPLIVDETSQTAHTTSRNRTTAKEQREG